MTFFGGSFFFDFTVTLIIACAAVFAYVVRRRNIWTRKGIPVSNASTLFGNMKDVLLRTKSMHEVTRDFYLQNKNKPYVTFFALTQPMVMVNDMEVVKKILIKDFQFFPDRNVATSPKDTMLTNNMFQAKGEFWKTLRVKLSPTFTSGKLKKMFELMDACGRGFVSYLDREKDQQGDIDVREASARFTSDIITSTAFGLEGDALTKEDSVFRSIMRESVTFSPVQSFFVSMAFLYPWVVSALNIVLTKKIVIDFLRSTVWQTVDYREKNNVKRNDFLDLMLQLRRKGHIDDDDDEDVAKDNGPAVNGMGNDKFNIDGDIFVAQCFVFMMAGFETSSSTMSFALYEMALQPDIQQRAYDEITAILDKHGGRVTYEAIQEMSYLSMTVNETLRKYPVLSFLDRKVTQPYKLPGTDIVLERGQGVMIPVLGIHWDPDIYPEPERFDPERFSAENSKNRPACSFLGFGDGPRICIGMRMGLVQTKIGLVYLLKNFSVSPCEKTPVPIVYDKNAVLHAAEGGITLRLKKRS